MLRIGLFVATNLAVLVLASFTLKLFGVDQWFAANGLGGMTGMLIFCAVFGMGGSFISLLLSKTIATHSTGTRIIKQAANRHEQWLVNTVAELANEAGIGMPDVGVFDSPQSNAFATGASKDNALVAVSTGLLHRFREDEVRAVLGHEIAHIANGDMVTMTLLQGVLNTFVMFFARIVGSIVDSALRGNNDNRGFGIGYFLVTIVAEIVLGLLASIIVAWFSRYREYRADAGGASLAGRGAMINALQRLKQESQMPDQMPETLQAFAITTGVRQGFKALFMSHPPLDDRIRALENA